MSWYKQAFQKIPLEDYLKESFKKIVPQEVIDATQTARKECMDPYCQTYIDAIGSAMARALQMNESLEKAIKVQYLYIYSNMEDYPNEYVKNLIADFADIPQENRHERYENPEFHEGLGEEERP